MKKLQRGLPRGRYSKHGYKRNSPDVNKPFNIIPSGRITMQDVDFPVKGIDNLGNEQIMYPGLDYIFPGDYVLELPMMQPGGQYYTPASENTRVNYTPVMTVQAAKKLKAQRDAQELARRKQAIQASQAAASKPLRKRLTPENLAQETGATGDKLRFFPNDPDSFIDEYLNPFKMIGDMASGLGRIPLNIKQGNYGQAAMSVATPLVVGATAGLGAKSAGQFVNNLANPLAGTGQFLTESVGNIFKKKQPLPDWAIAQMRYLSLPELNNPEASEVLENFLIRISTPEGKKRLKELGITNTKVFDNLKIIANKDTYGEYWLNKIALHPELPGVRNVTRHEIEHAVQDALSNSRIDKYNFSLKKTDAAYNESLKPTSDIDDILSGLELRKTPQKVDWNAIKSVDKETPLKPDRLFDYFSDKQRATNYFDSGSRGQEKSAFLAEVQQYMMDKGTIPKISYMDITPEMVKKTFIDSRFDQENLGKFLRLFNIMKPTENNYELISKGLNKMLSLAPYAVPAAIGAGTYGVNQKQDAQPTMQKFGGNLNFQFGGYIPSWLNPMNWGVTDYTGKKDFNSAYAAARQAGEKEFMWNGKRFNTDYKGTPQQQLKETGLTNEQIQDRSKLNKNLTKNIYPYSYDNLEKRIWAAGVLGKKEENREAIDKDPRPYDKEKLDALNLYAGVPQKNNTFRISNYKPSISKDNINYYTFNKQDDRFVKNLIDYAYLKSKGAIDGSAKDYDIDVKGLVPDQEKNVMGNYKMSTGKDDRGTYVSFYDKWDLAPMDFGKPFEIYDRIYTKDYSDGKQKRMYYTDKELLELDINKKNFDTLALQRELANRGYKLSKSTKKDGIFDGILGEETKKALEDWQKKNSKKQLGGALLKAQFGAFGTIPTSPPFMPQKENVVTSKKVDNLPKIKVNTTVPDEMITIKDGRKIRLTTGQAINPNTDLVGKSYPTKTLRSILDTAKNKGLSKDDALTLAAMDLQETRWGETDESIGHVLHGNDFAKSPVENFINAYLKSKETADRLKLSDEYTRLQVYNGLGTVTPDTEKDYHGFRMKKIYGVPVPASGINMRKNPLYGKQIVDIRDNVLKQNPEFLKLVDEYYKMGGVTNEMLDVYKNYINGVYTNTEKEKDAIKIYDKLNRKYYREAKNANKSVPNYIMSLIK